MKIKLTKDFQKGRWNGMLLSSLKSPLKRDCDKEEPKEKVTVS
jgi:hypothetical protein